MIRLKNVSKRYNLRANKAFLLRDVFLHAAGRKPTTTEFWALRNIDLEVQRGEALAVMGRNGAGKSTLLGLIAGTIFPTDGTVETEGRICALLELGVGFSPDLTGRENIFLNAALLGLTEREVRARFDEIVAFSEIEKFIDTPVGKYSSGMVMRLGFSVAIHIDPEVLIIDEMLTVGDQSFRKKCRERIGALKARGCTFLLVSHSPDDIKFLCQRAVWIHQGEVKLAGDVDTVLAEYNKVML